MRHVWWSGISAGLLLIPTLAFAEQVEIVTYYPAPSTTTDDLRVKRATVGSTYKTLNLDDELAKIPDGSLLVEGAVGIGAATPPLQAPDGSTAGNLNVNDIFIRSMNSGAGLWASQALAADLAPPHPYLLAFEIPPADSNVAYDVYTVLELWKFGIARDRVIIRGYMLLGWNGQNLNPPPFTPINSQPWPQGLSTPRMTNGVITIDNRAANNGTGSVLLSVDWPPYAP